MVIRRRETLRVIGEIRGRRRAAPGEGDAGPGFHDRGRGFIGRIDTEGEVTRALFRVDEEVPEVPVDLLPTHRTQEAVRDRSE